jgi:hypothetical protein
MKRVLTILLRWAVVVTYAGFMFYLSSCSQPIPIEGLQLYLPSGADKVFHFFECAFLCYLLCRAVDVSMARGAPPAPSRMGYNALVLCFLCTVLYGLSDEIHQLFTPLRTCDAGDLAADAAGAALVAMLWPTATAWLPFLRG